jgi:hypothetical protein
MSLSADINALPEELPADNLEVDISSFFGLPKKTKVWTYREPDIAETYQIALDAAKLLQHALSFPENLRLTIAMLAMGHVSPAPGKDDPPIALEYLRLAKTNKRLFNYLAGRFNEAFPHLMGSKAALEEEKKDGENGEPSSPSV